MGQSTRAREIENSLQDLYKTASKLVEEGFLITGAIFVTKSNGGPKNQQAMKQVSEDGRVGVLRFGLPPGVPSTQAKGMNPVKAAAIVVAEDVKKASPVPPASAPTGNVCPNCQSPNLRRSGTCETCQDCGSTTGCG